MTFFNFAGVQNPTDTHRDIFVESLGAHIRMLKLTGLQLLPMLTMRDGYEKTEGGKLANDEDVLECAVSMVAKSATNDKGELQFDSEEGREFLNTSLAVFELLPVAHELNELDKNPAKKKRKSRR